MLTLYGYPKCSTCRAARKWLEEQGHELHVIDITLNPPPKALLQRIVASGDYSLRALFNTSGELYRKMNLKDRLPSLSDAEALDLLSRHGKLCKRPIVTDGQRATVGFKPAAFEAAWG